MAFELVFIVKNTLPIIKAKTIIEKYGVAINETILLKEFEQVVKAEKARPTENMIEKMALVNSGNRQTNVSSPPPPQF